MDAEIKALVTTLIEGQIRTDKSLNELTRAVSGYVDAADARMEENRVGLVRTEETINDLTLAVTRYVDAADARMRRIEENLDGLIRAISTEHSNGKSRH